MRAGESGLAIWPDEGVINRVKFVQNTPAAFPRRKPARFSRGLGGFAKGQVIELVYELRRHHSPRFLYSLCANEAAARSWLNSTTSSGHSPSV